jgi:hypothetical protein
VLLIFSGTENESHFHAKIRLDSPESVAEARILYLFNARITSGCLNLDEDIRFYKGKHRVKVVTRSRGNCIVESLEPFEDVVNGEKLKVETKERRIVAPNLLLRKESLTPPFKEHAYELKMEKKLKQLVKEKESEGTSQS